MRRGTGSKTENTALRIAYVAPEEAGNAFAEAAKVLAGGIRSLSEISLEEIALPKGGGSQQEQAAIAARCNAPDIDVVHLHHAPGFWGEIGVRRYRFWDLRYLLKKPIVLTAHDVRPLEKLLPPDIGAFWQRLVKRRLLAHAEFRDSIEVAPFLTALTIVSTAWERNLLLHRGAKSGYVYIVPTAVPALPDSTLTNNDSLLAAANESSIMQNSRVPDIITVNSSPADSYAVEKALGLRQATLAPDTATTREIMARVPCLELYHDTADAEAKRSVLMSDPARCKALAEAASRYATRFAPERVAKQTLRVYSVALLVFGSGKH